MSLTSLPWARQATAAATMPLAAVDESRGRTFPCESCGADLTFHIGAQRLKCTFCGFEKDLRIADDQVVSERDLVKTLERNAARRHSPVALSGQAHEIRCDACGGTVAFEGTLTSTSCAYCGSPTQREAVHDAHDRVAVDALLTFTVESMQARLNLARWVRSRWFAPNEFKRQGLKGKLEGIYLPYYSFDAMTSTNYHGARGDHYWVTVGHGNKRRRERRTRWTSASGWFQRFFDDVLVPALTSLPFAILCRLEPWPLGKCVPYTADALAGRLAHTYDVELAEGFSHGKERIEEALRADVCSRIGGDEQRIDAMHTSYAALTFKHLLLPVWLNAYRFRDKSYRVFVNACTGRVEGERPYSAVKIAFAVLLGLIALGLAYWYAEVKL